jgi:hypothetical protein
MVWFGYGPNGGPAGIGSVDPSTSPATVTLNATNDPTGTWFSAPELTASPTGDLVAGQPGLSPLEIASYDVSTGTATTLTPKRFLGNYAGLDGMQITPDGTDVVVATGGGSPPFQTIFQVSDLSVVGDYPTGSFTAGVAIAGDGTVAAGTMLGQVYLFAPGGSTPLDTYTVGSPSLSLVDLALSPDVSELFAVTLAGVTVSGPPGRHHRRGRLIHHDRHPAQDARQPRRRHLPVRLRGRSAPDRVHRHLRGDGAARQWQ